MYNQEEIAKLLNITRTTLYNWKNTKPLLYKIIMEYFKKKDSKDEELLNLINKLTDIEKEMYLSEMKARILRREVDKKG